jgi:hypothetical protein
MSERSRLGITNYGTAPLIVMVEPWANDFTLLPGESLDIIAWGFTEDSYFNLAHGGDPDYLPVYIEGPCEDWAVYQGDTELQCGHNRAVPSPPDDWAMEGESGLEPRPDTQDRPP